MARKRTALTHLSTVALSAMTGAVAAAAALTTTELRRTWRATTGTATRATEVAALALETPTLLVSCMIAFSSVLMCLRTTTKVAK